MTSILTNNSAMNALSTLRNINNNLGNTQDRISSGLKVSSGKDNAAYFGISQSMKSDSSLNKAVNESMSLAKNAVATARLGVEAVSDLAAQYIDRLAFAANNQTEAAAINLELTALGEQMDNIVKQSTFNGTDLLSGSGVSLVVTTGVVRGTADPTTMAATQFTVATADVTTMITNLKAITATTTTPADANAELAKAKIIFESMTDHATKLGIGEKTIENQQSFLKTLTDRLDSGIGSMIDADMEEEAARLQALQVQQQLSTQALSIANQGPQNILSLFR